MGEKTREAGTGKSSEDSSLFSSLMRCAQGGDGEAYELLLSKVYPVLKAFVLKRMGQWERADDVVQEILLSIHRARHTYNCEQAFLPWMYSIAQFRLIDYWRKVTRITEREIYSDSIVNSSVEVKDMSGGLPSHLEIALAELPLNQQEAIRLLKVEGLSVREAARKMGLSESAVKVSAHRGYKALSLRLELGLYGE